MDENTAPELTTEEVQSLSSDQLIEMVANNEKIPYEKMTDEQLDLMEEIMAAFMDVETLDDSPLSTEEKTHSKQRILRDVNKIDTEKFSKFTQKEATVKLKSRHSERAVKKMDSSKKNLFVKRHDMRQRMIEPTTVTFVRKLKSEKLQFMSQGDEEEKGESEAAVEVGRLKLKEFFGIEDETESKPKPDIRVNKLNVDNLFSSNKDEQEIKSPERPEIKKLNIREAFNPDAHSGNEVPKTAPAVGKLDMKRAFSVTNEDDAKPEKTTPVVNKLNISKAFPVNDQEETESNKEKNIKVGKLNMTAVFSQKELESETVAEDNGTKESVPQAKKLDLSQFLQSNAEGASTADKDIPSSIGKLNVNAFVGSNDSENETKSENELVKVGKLRINSEMFVSENEEEQKAKAEKLSRAQSIKKIDKNKFLNSQSEGEEDESKIKSEKPLTVGKLNVNAMKFATTDLDESEESNEQPKSSPVVGKLNVSAEMFMSPNEEVQAQLEQSKFERNQAISKIDTSRLFANNDETSELQVEQKAPEIRKLNVSEKLFQEDADEKLERMKSEKLSRINSINKIDRSKFVLKSKDDDEEDQEPKPEKPIVNKLRISEEMFCESSAETLQNEEKTVSVGKIDTSKLFDQKEETSPVKKEILEVKKLRISEEAFREESDEKLEKLKNEKLNRANSINKIDRSKLILKSHDEDVESSVKPEKPQVNKLRISEEMFCQSSLENVPNEEKVVSVGKIDTSKLFEQNEESVPIKKEVLEVKKLQFSEDAFREDSDEKIQKLEKEKLSRVNSINKIDRSKLILKSRDEDEESESIKPEKPQVNKLQISESMFTQSLESSGAAERVTNVGKIDKSMLQFSDEQQIKRTVEDAPVNISKLNVSEAMFMQSAETDESVKQSKLQRNQSVKKMDSSRYVLSNTDANPDTERRPSITANVGKLNMDGLFSSAESNKTEQQPKKRNLQELIKEEKEKSKMPTVHKSSMHAQHVKTENQFEDDEVISAQSADTCFTAPSLPGFDSNHYGKEDDAAHSDALNGNTETVNGASQQQNKSISSKFQISPELEKQSKCKVCQKRVYETEKITVSGTLYHKVCFRCAQCNNTLRLTNYCLSVAGEVYCKPHFEQLFRVTGSYNIESNSGALKSFHAKQSAENNEKREEDVQESEDVALPDLKSIKSRFESGSHGDGASGQNLVVIDREASGNNSSGVKVSTLKSQWTNMSSNGTVDSENGAQKSRNNDIELCRSASQLRAQFDKKNASENNENQPPMEDPRLASLDPDRVKEDLNQKERPETIAGGLASVKNMFESGGNNNRSSEQKNGPTMSDESLQAALANRAISAKTLLESSSHHAGATEIVEEALPHKVEDESLLAARQGRSVAMRNMFENNQNSGTSSPRSADMESGEGNATKHQDELAAIRASRGSNMKAVFESGGAESKTVTSKTYEDESLAAARAKRGVANKAVFEGSAPSEDNFTKSAATVAADVQAGKAKDLLSKFESGQVNDNNKVVGAVIAEKSTKDEQNIKNQAAENSSMPQSSPSPQHVSDEQQPNESTVVGDESRSSPSATNGIEEVSSDKIPDVVVSLELEEQAG